MMISLPIFASKTITRIEVFTYDDFPIVHESNIDYCNLDELKHLEKVIQDNAERLLIHPEILNKYNQPLTQAYQCRFQATAYELKFLPAIVINQSHVAYGYQNIKQALDSYERNHV